MSDTATQTKAPAVSSRPIQPSEEAYKAEVAKAEEELAKAQKRLIAAKAKLDAVQNSKDSPQGKANANLRQEQAEIRKQHQSHKDARNKNMEQVKRLDEKLKSILNEQKSAKSKIPYKSVEEIDERIKALNKQVDTGSMKLVDERKALEDVKALHRSKKQFDGFATSQKQIDELRAQIADLKKTNENPEVKALNDRYDDIQRQLNEQKEKNDESFKNINALRDERTKAYNEQQAKYQKMKEIKDTYFAAKRAYQEYDFQQRKARRERIEQEKRDYESGKRKEIAQQKLEEASSPAYGEEIHTAQGLIRHFDPTTVEAKSETAPSKFAAAPSRTIEAEPPKGTRVVSKKDNDEEYFAGSSKKKGKKAKETTAPTKFNISVDVISSLARIGIDPPVSQSHVPIVVTQLKEKIDFWKKDQDRKTKENIAKAQKEIEKLEQEASPSAPANANKGAKDTHSKPADANQGTNGKVDAEAVLRQEEDGAADAAAELKKASLEDANGV